MVYHALTKHTEVCHHYIHQLVENEDVCLDYCLREMQITNIMTEPLGRDKVVNFIDKLGIISGFVIEGY